MELLRVQLLRGIFQTRIILSFDIELLHNISGREFREPLQSYDGYWLDLLEALVRFWRTLISCFDFNERLIVVWRVAGHRHYEAGSVVGFDKIRGEDRDARLRQRVDDFLPYQIWSWDLFLDFDNVVLVIQCVYRIFAYDPRVTV